MRTIVLLITYTLLAILLIPLLLFCYPIKFAEPIILMGKWAFWVGQKILGIRLDASGIERIDKRVPYVFMANHLEYDAETLQREYERDIESGLNPTVPNRPPRVRTNKGTTDLSLRAPNRRCLCCGTN